MKSFALVLITLNFFFSSITCETTCKVYKCSDFTLPGDLCYYERNDIIQLKKCSSSATCNIKLEIASNMRYCLEAVKKKYPDESCNIDEECETDYCVNNTCARKSSCRSNLDCLNNAFCWLGGCINIVSEGETCTADKNCPLNQICSKTVCETMHSIEVGEPANDKMLCKSEFLDDKLCAESESTAASEECKTDEDCSIKITYNSKAAEKISKGKCKCSYNGKKYCSITTKNDVWQDYLSRYEKSITRARSRNIHIPYERENYWGDLDLQTASKKKNDYPNFKDVDSCTERYLLTASYIKTSLLSLLAFIIAVLI